MTLAECEIRYGQARRLESVLPQNASCDPSGAYIFKQYHYCIEILFYKGKASSIHIIDYETDNGRADTPLTKKEVSDFLKENALDGAWIEGPTNSEGYKTWFSQNRRLIAQLDDVSIQITIRTKEFEDIRDALFRKAYQVAPRPAP
jgi:hypothetical protein